MSTVVYALGGGRGHLQRARTLAARLDGPVQILHQAPEEAPNAVSLGRCTRADAQQALARALVGAHTLIVDTFPGGIAHELVWPESSVRTVLIARHVDRAAYDDYDALAERFDEVWLPYASDGSEWEDPPCRDRAVWVGPIVRPVALDGEADLLVIGADEPPAWTPLLADAVRVQGPFERLPRARRTLALSAGYNLAWELNRLGLRPAFRPLPRRFDDQFARAARLGVPVHHRRDLERFLEAPCS